MLKQFGLLYMFPTPLYANQPNCPTKVGHITAHSWNSAQGQTFPTKGCSTQAKFVTWASWIYNPCLNFTKDFIEKSRQNKPWSDRLKKRVRVKLSLSVGVLHIDLNAMFFSVTSAKLLRLYAM